MITVEKPWSVEWSEEIYKEYRDYVVIESTPNGVNSGYFYDKWKETEMEEVQVKRFFPGNLITYPEKRFVGTANDKGLMKDPENFQLRTDICELRKAEFIQEPKFFLRGLIIFDSKEYIFTAMVDFNDFNEADYQKVIQVAYDKIRMGHYQIGVTQESLTPDAILKEKT
jgi:hypothetical protein